MYAFSYENALVWTLPEKGLTSSLFVQPAKNVGSVIGSDKYD